MRDSYHFLKGLPLGNIKINDVVVVVAVVAVVVVVVVAVVVQSCAPVWPSGKALGW